MPSVTIDCARWQRTTWGCWRRCRQLRKDTDQSCGSEDTHAEDKVGCAIRHHNTPVHVGPGNTLFTVTPVPLVSSASPRARSAKWTKQHVHGQSTKYMRHKLLTSSSTTHGTTPSTVKGHALLWEHSVCAFNDVDPHFILPDTY